MTTLVSIVGRAVGVRRVRFLVTGAMLLGVAALLVSPLAQASTSHSTATVVEATDNEHVGTDVKVLTVTNGNTVAITEIEGNGGTEHVLPASACKGGEGFSCNLTVAPGASQTICIASGRAAENIQLTYANGEKEMLEPKGGPAVAKCPIGSFSSTGTGSTKCVVPSLKGKKLKTAENALKNAHCAVGAIKKARSKHIKKGDVISQSQTAGKSLASGTKVNLTVSKGA